MPYFVYHITINPENNVKKLRHLNTFDAYKDARALAREERGQLKGAVNEECRMIYAKSEVEAKTMLSKPRDTRVIGED